MSQSTQELHAQAAQLDALQIDEQEGTRASEDSSLASTAPSTSASSAATSSSTVPLPSVSSGSSEAPQQAAAVAQRAHSSSDSSSSSSSSRQSVLSMSRAEREEAARKSLEPMLLSDSPEKREGGLSILVDLYPDRRDKQVLPCSFVPLLLQFCQKLTQLEEPDDYSMFGGWKLIRRLCRKAGRSKHPLDRQYFRSQHLLPALLACLQPLNPSPRPVVVEGIEFYFNDKFLRVIISLLGRIMEFPETKVDKPHLHPLAQQLMAAGKLEVFEG